VNLEGDRTGKLLLALASIVIFGSEFQGTYDPILLSHDSGSRATPQDLEADDHSPF
jgi:hypothetical protein